ncbi:MAG: lipid A biosynthesis acyltransferase, partial [bacterium]
NERVVREAIRQKRNIVFISAHFGNWEVMLPAIAVSLCPFTAVSKSLKDKKIDDFVTRSRERFGVNIVEKRGAVRHLVKAMRKGKHIAIMVDQNVGGDGIEVSFFGKKASHTPVASHLARRFNALIIPAFSFPDPSFSHFDIYFYEPIQVKRSRDIEEDISRATQAQASITERVIRQNPEHWFWLHRRWKEYYRPVYNENSKLIDKLT